MNTALIRPIETEADYQAALERTGALMSSQPNTPEADLSSYMKINISRWRSLSPGESICQIQSPLFNFD